MIGTLTFKKFTGEKLENVEEYIKDYCKGHNNIEIMVGTDSQNKGGKTYYSTVIALYTPGHGAHCIFKRWNTPREKVRNTRLMNEVAASVETAESICHYNGCPKPKYIDLDINPNPKYKSNEVYTAAKGWCEGLGYEVRFKTLGPLVTTLADWLVKN